MRALGMHETVMEVMVNVLGGGDSKVFLSFINLCVTITLARKCQVIRWSTVINCFVFETFFPATGDQIPSCGNKLLPLSVLFLPDQSSESAFYV